MPEYRRAFVPGGTFFFTVVTAARRPILTTDTARRALRSAFTDVIKSHPFTMEAVVLLPDHLHCVWTLPPGDADFSRRWRIIKTMTTRRYLAAGGTETRRSRSRVRHAERGVWQRRSWERTVRDEAELIAFYDYIHYNPVRHGHVSCPHTWRYSSFARFVREGRYAAEWNCSCRRFAKAPNLDAVAFFARE